MPAGGRPRPAVAPNWRARPGARFGTICPARPDPGPGSAGGPGPGAVSAMPDLGPGPAPVPGPRSGNLSSRTHPGARQPGPGPGPRSGNKFWRTHPGARRLADPGPRVGKI